MSPFFHRSLHFALLLSLLVLLAGCDIAEQANAEAEAVAIETPAATLQSAMRVRVQAAEAGTAMGLNDVTGVTSAFRTATVASEVAGRVVKRHVEPGAFVKEGEPLLALDAVKLRIAIDETRAHRASRQTDYDEAKKQLDRGDVLRAGDTISERQHDEMRFGYERAASALAAATAAERQAERALRDATLRAPFDGTVETISAQTGDYLNPGTPVATLADFRKVRVRAGVTGAEADTLVAGRKAKVTIDALGGEERELVVQSVGRLADPTTGTYPVELWLENLDGRLRAGLVAQLRFAAPEGVVTGPLVPSSALVRRNGKLVAFVVVGSGESLRAVQRDVQVGRQLGQQVEILAGVNVGERVVTEGLFALRDGASIVIDGDSA